MSTPIHVFNIPESSAHVADVPGRCFDASLYEIGDRKLAAYIEIDSSATDQDLGADQMNTKIKAAAKGASVEYYVIRRRR